MTPLLRHEVPIPEFVKRNAVEFSARIIKEPSLTFIAPQMLDYFPEGRGAFVIRDPFQNIRSILNRLKIEGDLDALSPSLSNLPNQTWLSILSGVDLGFDPMHYCEVLAQRWVKATNVYLDDPDRYVLLRYEDFSKQKRKSIEELARKLGLVADRPFDNWLDYQFQPAGQSGMTAPDFFGKTNWNRIADICWDTMQAVGYVGNGS